MDPLSITASIIAVLQATKEVIGYLKETKDASKELAKVYDEARNVVILLHELKDSLAEQEPHDSWLRATSGLTVRDGPLDQYKYILELLASKIITNHDLHRVGQVLVWKFNKEEVNSLLSQIERVKSLVLIALELDHRSVIK